MYVCLCEGVTDRRILEAIAAGAVTLHDIAAQTEATTNCGVCTEAVTIVLDDALSAGTGGVNAGQ